MKHKATTEIQAQIRHWKAITPEDRTIWYSRLWCPFCGEPTLEPIADRLNSTLYHCASCNTYAEL